MNVYDSDRMTDVLTPLGYEPVDAPDGADMVILNTCHIREKAAEKVYSELGRIRQLKKARKSEGQDMIVAVAGCVAQAEGAEIRRRQPIVDMVFGPQSYHRLPELVAKVSEGQGAVLDTDFPVEDKFDQLPDERRIISPTAFVTIQEGCDKFCTFCVVPYTRGAEFSRAAAQIAQEVRRLVLKGVREVTLLGQNVNAYHGASPESSSESSAGRGVWGLADLIRHLADIDGLERIRYTTSHPRDMDDGLILAHADVPQLMPYLHLPVQSGADRILAAMNRQHTADHYRRLVARIRDARPEIALSSDFIVGFPGETDKEFQDTLQLVRDIGYAQAYSFKYSARPGTPAATMPEQIPEEVQTARLLELQELLKQQQRDFNAAFAGRTLPVLFEKDGRHPGQIVGRSPYLHVVHVPAHNGYLGRIRDVKIDAIKPNSLGGHLVKSDLAIGEFAHAEPTIQVEGVETA